MTSHSFLAFDLGAESGRAIAGILRDRRLELHELHRFPNRPAQITGHLHWNIVQLFEELKTGLRKAVGSGLQGPASIGIDTWGVDFGFLAGDGSLLGMPYAYRDPQTDGMMEELLTIIPKERLYALTGIQFMQLNSVVQLLALRKRGSSILEAATDLLFMPDLLTYLFTGVKRSEFTIATTSQMLGPASRTWEKEIIRGIGVDEALFQEIVLPGTTIGSIHDSVRSETGAPDIPVVAVATHDTGSAVAAVPARGTDWAYISSGTWSLMGIEISEPILTAEAMRHNFTNEGGVDGTIRFLKNIAGLWLVQECRRQWSAAGNELSYGTLVERAEAAQAFRSIVDPDWPGFLHPADMRTAIRTYCRETGQPLPDDPGQFARCVFESLALKYRDVLDQLQAIRPARIAAIHMIGGGSRNRFLCQCTADSTGLPVLAGPSEATAIGNIMVQARAAGLFASAGEMREIISSSSVPERYVPRDAASWDRAYGRYSTLLAQSIPEATQ